MLFTCFEHFSAVGILMQSQHFSAVGGFNGYFMVIFKASHFDSECRNRFLGYFNFSRFSKGLGACWGHIGGIHSKGLGMLSSAEVANLLRDVGACSPREILKFRRFELLFSAFFQSVFVPKVQSNL